MCIYGFPDSYQDRYQAVAIGFDTFTPTGTKFLHSSSNSVSTQAAIEDLLRESERELSKLFIANGNIVPFQTRTVQTLSLRRSQECAFVATPGSTLSGDTTPDESVVQEHPIEEAAFEQPSTNESLDEQAVIEDIELPGPLSQHDKKKNKSRVTFDEVQPAVDNILEEVVDEPVVEYVREVVVEEPVVEYPREVIVEEPVVEYLPEAVVEEPPSEAIACHPDAPFPEDDDWGSFVNAKSKKKGGKKLGKKEAPLPPRLEPEPAPEPAANYDFGFGFSKETPLSPSPEPEPAPEPAVDDAFGEPEPAPEPAVDDAFGWDCPIPKKKKKGKTSVEPEPVPEPAVHNFGWSSGWDSSWATHHPQPTTPEPDLEPAVEDFGFGFGVSKKKKKGKSAPLIDPLLEPEPTPEPAEDNFGWGSIPKKQKKHKALIEEEPQAPEPAPEPVEDVPEWNHFSTSKKKKKGKTVVEVEIIPSSPPLELEPEPEPEPELEQVLDLALAENYSFGFGSSKKKKKGGKTAIEVEIPPSPPLELEPAPELAAEDFWGFSSVKKKKKGETLIEEETPPLPEPKLDDSLPNPPLPSSPLPSEPHLRIEEGVRETSRSEAPLPPKTVGHLKTIPLAKITTDTFQAQVTRSLRTVVFTIQFPNEAIIEPLNVMATIADNTHTAIIDAVNSYLDSKDMPSQRKLEIKSAVGRNGVIDVSTLEESMWPDYLDYFVNIRGFQN